MNREVLADHRRTNWTQSALLLGAVATVLFLLAYSLFGWWAGWIAVGVAVILFFVTPSVSPGIILKMYRAKPMRYERFPELAKLMAYLASRAKLPVVPSLHYLPSDVMNAFTVGRPDKAVVAVSDGLLRRLNYEELAGVLAHEITHIQNQDMRLMGFADVTGKLVASLSRLGQFLLFINLPLMLTGQATISWLTIAVLILAPSLTTLAQLALSRTREFAADQGAAELIGDPRPLEAALAKIEEQSSNLLKKMFGGKKGIPAPSILRTHPHTKERLERLREMRPTTEPLLGILPPAKMPPLAHNPYRPSWHRTGAWF